MPHLSRRPVCLVASLAPVLVAACSGPGTEFDLVLHGGRVLAGTGAPAVEADVAVRDGIIAAVGSVAGTRASRVIDVSGLYVTPGFIDLHSHADEGLSDTDRAGAANFLTQGVTTAVVGQDGESAWPDGSSLSEQVARWDSGGLGLNILPLVGHMSVRRAVMGRGCEAASASQLDAMARAVAEVLREGVWGLSTGVAFSPCASLQELVAVTRPVSRFHAVHASHVRDEGDSVLSAVEEVVKTGAVTGATMIVSHVKVSGPANWGKAKAIVRLLDSARRDGVAVYADLYPYTTSGGGFDVALVPPLRSILPPDFPGESPPPLGEWFSDSRLGTVLDSAVKAAIQARGGAERIVITRSLDEHLVGLTLAQAAARRKLAPARTAAVLTAEGAHFMAVQMAENDIEEFIRQPYVGASSDGWIPESSESAEHPRSYGAFTRRLRIYVRERGIVTWSFAIHTATGLAAEILGLSDRGLIREGFAADLLVLDPVHVGDRATYGEPHRYSQGVIWVLVNGKLVVENGVPNGTRAGRVLLKTPTSRPGNSGVRLSPRRELANKAHVPFTRSQFSTASPLRGSLHRLIVEASEGARVASFQEALDS